MCCYALPARCTEPSAERGPGAYPSKMMTNRIRRLVAGGVLAASAVIGAATALAQPDNPADPGPITPGSPGAPQGPNDLRCIAQPTNGACAGGPYAFPPGSPPGTIPGSPPGAIPDAFPGTMPGMMPGVMPGAPPGGGMGDMGGMPGMGGI